MIICFHGVPNMLAISADVCLLYLAKVQRFNNNPDSVMELGSGILDGQ